MELIIKNRKLATQKAINFNIKSKLNSSNEQIQLLSKLEQLKNNCFVINFVGINNNTHSNKQTIYELFAYHKISNLPIALSILVNNEHLEEPKLIYYQFSDKITDFKMIWNDFILKHYNFEQVILFDEELTKNILFHFIPYTKNENWKKVRSFLQALDIQTFFLPELWTDNNLPVKIMINNEFSPSFYTLNNLTSFFDQIANLANDANHQFDLIFSWENQRLNREFDRIIFDKQLSKSRLDANHRLLEQYAKLQVLNLFKLLTSLDLSLKYLAHQPNEELNFKLNNNLFNQVLHETNTQEAMEQASKQLSNHISHTEELFSSFLDSKSYKKY